MFQSVDLFAGAGGLSLGLRAAGFHTRVAVEIDRWAAQTFQRNFPEAKVVSEDIAGLDPLQEWGLDIPAPSLVVGGPPCQGFSHSNLNRDPRDPRNSLFREFVRWVEALSPEFALIENVPGLLRAKTGDGRAVLSVIEAELRDRGYVSKWRLLQAAEFGVPQKRERLFILAAKSSASLDRFKWPTGTCAVGGDLFTHNTVNLMDAISDLPEDAGPYVTAPASAYQAQMRSEFRGAAPSHHEPMRHTARILERFRSIKCGESEGSVAEPLQPRKRGGAEEIGRAYSQNSRRQRPDEPCSTIVASSHTNFIHPLFHRNFTVRELMRIQSFPDNFELCGKRAVLSKKLSIKKGYLDDVYLDQRMQIGNAVPPLLAQALGKAIAAALIQERISDAA